MTLVSTYWPARLESQDKKQTTECWNILRSAVVSAIDRYVPMKKQRKRSKKKQLSKEAFRKIKYKEVMLQKYKHTGEEHDFKEALNAATKVRKSKRNFILNCHTI